MKEQFTAGKNKFLSLLEEISNTVDLETIGLLDQFIAEKEQFNRELAFTVLILGEFSSGKTTFVNKYFFEDQKMLPTATVPTTARLCTVRYANETSIRVHYKDGTSKNYSGDEEVREVAKKTLFAKGADVDATQKVDFFYPSPRLKEGIVIVDSPGLNDPEIERSKITTDYMDRSDCVLYFLSALQAGKASELELFRTRLLGKKHFNKIFFILNRWDDIHEDEREDVLDYVTSLIGKQVEDMRPDWQGEEGEISKPLIIPISSQTGENFDKLEHELWNYLADKSGATLFRLKADRVKHFLTIIAKRIKDSQEMYHLSQEEISKNIELLEKEVLQFESKIDDFRKELYADLLLGFEEYRASLQKIFEPIAKKITKSIQNNAKNFSIITADNSELQKEFSKIARGVLYREHSNFKQAENKFSLYCQDIVDNMKARLNLSSINLSPDYQIMFDSPESMENVTIENDQTIIPAAAGGAVLSALAFGSVFTGVGVFMGIIPLIWGYVQRKAKVEEAIGNALPDIDKVLNDQFSQCIEAFDANKSVIFERILEHTSAEILDLYRLKKKDLETVYRDKDAQAEELHFARLEEDAARILAFNTKVDTILAEISA